MDFSIDYGPPGLFGALFIGLGAIVAVIVLVFFVRAAREAHDSVEEERDEEIR
ncbi:hypothetical protein [Sphingomonas morindae]|uniref:Uncharacterized protein n=1 Tax=Sphingomonas morindae TaxID=1541170 RepID=A0ABY4X631_9SPHN|nr:hypothetical protein [Sphingomonas morindae]USI72333.1 hypothetical protein LHA26_13685 [Sphingomonas morindae]